MINLIFGVVIIVLALYISWFAAMHPTVGLAGLAITWFDGTEQQPWITLMWVVRGLLLLLLLISILVQRKVDEKNRTTPEREVYADTAAWMGGAIGLSVLVAQTTHILIGLALACLLGLIVFGQMGLRLPARPKKAIPVTPTPAP